MYKFVWKSFSKEKWKSLQESKLSGGRGGKEKRKKKTGFEMDPSINHTPRNRTRLIANPGVQRVNNDPGVSKISAKLARFERFDIVYSDDWRAACAISTFPLARGPGPLSCKTATQISNPRFDCHSTGNGDGDCAACRDAKSNRVESMFPAALLHLCKCIHPSFSPSFFSSSFHPIDRNIARTGEREREVSSAAYATCPYPRHRRAKMVKRGEEGVWRSSR